jgi:hypothetical protein
MRDPRSSRNENYYRIGEILEQPRFQRNPVLPRGP